MNKFNHNLDYSEYCNSVIECTDYEGNLSEPNLHKLLHDHGANYYELTGTMPAISLYSNGADWFVF